MSAKGDGRAAAGGRQHARAGAVRQEVAHILAARAVVVVLAVLPVVVAKAAQAGSVGLDLGAAHPRGLQVQQQGLVYHIPACSPNTARMHILPGARHSGAAMEL